jgi:DNA-binding CsgD family transcriptional regulator
MIIGRTEELAALMALVGDLCRLGGRALLVRGQAGAGKTTLLEEAARCASAEGGATVVRACGVETESELPFAGLVDLVSPIATERSALPAPQAEALAGALALGPPRPGDRLAICVAALGLLRAAALARPVLAVVDDVQWLDQASRECVLYAARRTGGAVSVLLAVRDGAPAAAAIEGARLPELHLGALDRAAARTLLGRVAPDLAPPVARALVGAAAGNPLALVELPGTLSPDQRAGVAPLPNPLAPGARVGAVYEARIAALPPATREALLVAAAYEGDDLATLAAAGAAVDRLADAEAGALVRLESDRLVFGHPLIRGAAYRGASASARRDAHRALAAVLGGERRAWHLAAAAAGPDEDAAAGLEQFAADAQARRAFASASAAFERAARLTPGATVRRRRICAAADAAAAAGDAGRAVALFAEAAESVSDPLEHARVEHRRAAVMAWSGSVREAAGLLVEGADRVLVVAPDVAAVMLADAAAASTARNDYHGAAALVTRATALLGDGMEPHIRAHVLTITGWVRLLRGDGPGARDTLTRARTLAAGADPLGPAGHWLHFLVRARIAAGELECALTESLALCDQAREAGALSALGGALAVAADASLRLGQWAATDALTREAIRIASDTRQHVWHGYALTFAAWLAAARGDVAKARLLGAEAGALAEAIPTGLRYVHGAMGFLALGQDRVDDAIAELETVERLLRGSGLEEPTFVAWAPDLVEAYARAGRTRDATRLLDVLTREAAGAATATAEAPAMRCRGLLAADFDDCFGAALALDDERPMPFERARTLLAYGRRLHRARRRSEARTRLREALEGFQHLGAEAWAEQADHELRAAGARRRSTRSDALTPQERRVAAAVVRGASNREVAAELFLAPKTVEFHLGQIYRKLGVHSRTKLAAVLDRELKTRDSPGASARGAT